jgi:hypothetical protein
VVKAKLGLEKLQDCSALLCVNPAFIPIQKVLSAPVLSRVETNAHETTELTSQSAGAVTDTSESKVYVMLANFSQEDLILPMATVLDVTE